MRSDQQESANKGRVIIIRVLLLLRGSAGCGKSTWIEANGLKPYTLSADDIRLMCSSPVLTVSGREQINPTNDKVVWSTLFKILELRMQNGEFTVIDATNSKTSEMNRYKDLCSTYKYRIYCVDFTDIPIEVTMKRNRQRPVVKQVPDEAIEKMYARFQTQKIPSGITVIRPEELDTIWFKRIDLSNYKKVHHIGDVHGCYTALKEYFDNDGGLKDDEFYIFCGDYIDRGIENVEVIQFLLSIYHKPNVCLLEGNHEKWLWIWANNGVSGSKEFELVTKTQFDKAGISKKEVRKLYRKIGQCAYYTYGKNVYLVTHAGLSTVPENMTKIATAQMIKGVGNYNDFESVANSFVENTPDNYYQIHGHRNTKNIPPQVNDRVFNLEGKVEFGGCLRCVQIFPNGTHNVVETQNTVFKMPEGVNRVASVSGEKSVGDLIIELRKNRYIQEKKYGNISSFNFTKSAFYNKVWDEQTTKARGLYINIPNQKIVARAYDKFFNINERQETKLDTLQHKLAFPVTAYVKENGFLGIVSYNEEDDSLFIATKSSINNDFAGWFKEMLYNKVPKQSLTTLKEYARDNNVSFVFECVDMKNDPHIIDYPESEIYLLDIVKNDITYKKCAYNQICDVAVRLGFNMKEKAYIIENWQEFFDWYYDVTREDYKFCSRNIEGFVIEDANGYMVKLKLAYYNFWKFMRSISHEAIRKWYIDSRKTSALVTPLANQYYSWVKSLHNCENLDEVPKDICTLRKMFFKTEAGQLFIQE